MPDALKLFLPSQQGVQFVRRSCSTGFLKPVDLALERRAIPVIPQALECPGAIGGILGRGSRLAGDVPDERGFSCT
jgi:hypothetical protein